MKESIVLYYTSQFYKRHSRDMCIHGKKCLPFISTPLSLFSTSYSFQDCYLLKAQIVLFTFTALTTAGSTVKGKRGSSLPPNSPFSRQYHYILTSFLPLLLSALSPSTHTNTLQRSESLLDFIL